MPLVSIIVPVYNAANYLAECINSLINQSYENLEIICINDGSTDNSLDILQSYAKKDERIKVYSQENKGEAEVRNLGLTIAKGKYITALDADDSCSLDSIATSVELAEKNNADIVINYLNVRANMQNVKPKNLSYTAVWQLFYKKELIDRYPDIKYNKNLKMGPDVIYTHKILGLTDEILLNRKSIYNYRYHNEQISYKITNNTMEFMRNIRIWLEDLSEFYTKHNWWETHNYHMLNFLCEQPFTQYLRLNLDKQQQEELFCLIHDVVNKNKMELEFNYSNKRVKMFKIFLRCKNYKQFEVFKFVSHLYLAFIDWKKRYCK